MTETMLKQIAHAICLSAESGVNSYLADARAAVEAMKNPTEAVVKANWTQPIGGTVEEGFNAMLDAILNEESGQ